MLGGDRQEIAESGDITRAFGLSGTAQKLGGFPDPVFGQRPVGRGDGGSERSRTRGRDRS